ncbi:MAG: hypothetical protein ACP5VR_00180 [Acidimicrobiales bacterium]
MPTSVLVGKIVSAFFGFLAKWLAHGAVWMTSNVIGQAMTASTAPAVTEPWFLSAMGKMLPVEELVVAPLLFAATIGALLRQDMRRLARAWFACLPLAFFGGFLVVDLTNLGLQVTDALSQEVQRAVSPNLHGLYLALVPQAIVQLVTSGPATVFFSLVFMAGALVIWVELALRAAAIELAVLFMPLALAGLIWPATAHWAKRLLEVLVALLLAKPVIVGALCLGAHSLTTGQGGVGTLVTGIAILLVAAFAPVAVLKLVPVVEVATIAHLHELSRGPFHGAERAVQMAMSKLADVKGSSAAAPVGGEASVLTGTLLAKVSNGGDPLGPARSPSGDAGSARVSDA